MVELLTRAIYHADLSSHWLLSRVPCDLESANKMARIKSRDLESANRMARNKSRDVSLTYQVASLLSDDAGGWILGDGAFIIEV